MEEGFLCRYLQREENLERQEVGEIGRKENAVSEERRASHDDPLGLPNLRKGKDKGRTK